MSSELETLRSQFFAELAGSCEGLEQDLMRLEQAPEDAGTHKQILREIHTIKGNAGLVGEQAVQTLCHTLETTLDRLYRERRLDLASEYGLRAVDLLRSGIDAPEDPAVNERFREFTADLESEAPETPSGDGAEAPATARRVGSPISLDEWKRLVRAFAPVDAVVQTLGADGMGHREIRRMGVATVDLMESIPPRLGQLRTLANVAELTVQGVAGMPREVMKESARGFGPLLQFVTEQMRERLTDLFYQNSFSVTVRVVNLALLRQLETELRRREESPILILRFDVDYDVLERDWNVYDSFWSLASMPKHTVAFLLQWSSAVEKAARFLEQAIGMQPLVSHDEWDMLIQIAHHR